MTIIFKKLTMEERAVWGTCPVCEAPEGVACGLLAGLEDGEEDGTHVARLVNAPAYGAEVQQ